MAEFMDTKKRRWPVALTVGDIRRIRTATGVDLLSLFDEKSTALMELQTDLQLLLDVLFEATRKAREAKGVDDEEFADSLDADCAESAVNALLEALVDFFPSARRAALRAALAASNRAIETACKTATKQIEALDVEAIISAAKSGSESMNAPGS